MWIGRTFSSEYVVVSAQRRLGGAQRTPHPGQAGAAGRQGARAPLYCTACALRAHAPRVGLEAHGIDCLNVTRDGLARGACTRKGHAWSCPWSNPWSNPWSDLALVTSGPPARPRSHPPHAVQSCQGAAGVSRTCTRPTTAPREAHVTPRAARGSARARLMSWGVCAHTVAVAKSWVRVWQHECSGVHSQRQRRRHAHTPAGAPTPFAPRHVTTRAAHLDGCVDVLGRSDEGRAVQVVVQVALRARPAAPQQLVHRLQHQEHCRQGALVWCWAATPATAAAQQCRQCRQSCLVAHRRPLGLPLPPAHLVRTRTRPPRCWPPGTWTAS